VDVLRGRIRPAMFHADLHIHSKFSRACSKDCDIEHLSWWALRKGLRVLGTGDFTHPAWAAELKETLVEAEPGLFRIRPDLEQRLFRDTPASCAGTVRFMLSVEISTIYRRDDRTRKVHHLLYAPGFDEADRITAALARIGNLASDGRPILGLDSRDLLDITLSAGPGCFLVPAHVWTPWFAVLGSKSGFDAVRDCYADLADHIFAVETGLSSDPPMNWACSSLDGYRLVSNSDAHSPPMLGREATVLDTELSYFAIAAALRTRNGLPGEVGRLVAALGPELGILRDVPVDDVRRVGGSLLGEAIARLRRGEVIRDAGYDGEYGTIRLFQPDELHEVALFSLAGVENKSAERARVPRPAAPHPPPLPPSLPDRRSAGPPT